MTGAKFELEAPSSGFESMPPEPPTESAPMVGLAHQETKALPRPKPTEPIGRRAETEEPGIAVPQPGYAFGNLNVDEVAALPAPEGPSPFKEGTGAIDAAEGATDPHLDTEETVTREAIPRPMPPPAAPPTQPAQVSPDDEPGMSSRWIYAGMGFAAVSVLLGLGGFAAFWFFTPQAANNTTPAVEASTGADADIIAGMAGDVTVTLEAGDPTVQWIRLKDTSGSTRITARPDGSGQVMPGTYTLAVKVAARPALAKEIPVNEDTMLICKPATMGHVKCTGGSGRPPIVLKP